MVKIFKNICLFFYSWHIPDRFIFVKKINIFSETRSNGWHLFLRIISRIILSFNSTNIFLYNTAKIWKTRSCLYMSFPKNVFFIFVIRGSFFVHQYQTLARDYQLMDRFYKYLCNYLETFCDDNRTNKCLRVLT